MNCPKCNAINPMEVVFCLSCGERLSHPEQIEDSEETSNDIDVDLIDSKKKRAKTEAKEKKKKVGGIENIRN